MKKPITTTLNKIRAYSPCEDGWEKLLKHLGKTKGDDESLKFSTIAKSNGLDDALWCLRSICPEYDKEVRLYAANCAERVLHLFEEKYPDDKRPRLAIEASRQYARGEITAAAGAAWDAAGAAWDAAGAAAWDAAGAAARAAAWAAAGDAWDAARAAAWAAAGAAWDAAGDAAMNAARAAWDAAWAAERKIQTEMLIKYFG